jgi:clan AA aspartic protease
MRPVLYANKHKESGMGLTFAEITLINGTEYSLFQRKKLAEEDVKRIKVSMLVDSGAYMLAINEEICSQLDLFKVDERPAQMADGSVVNLDVVGPVEVRFANRRTNVDAIVLPGNAQPLLGVIPMEDMDVLIDPKEQTLIVNPAHPYKPLISLR